MSLQGLTSYCGASSLAYAMHYLADGDDEPETPVKKVDAGPCGCGCGERLLASPNTHPSNYPTYKRGHRPASTVTTTPRPCLCGCGGVIPYIVGKTRRYRWEKQRYLPGHGTVVRRRAGRR